MSEREEKTIGPAFKDLLSASLIEKCNFCLHRKLGPSYRPVGLGCIALMKSGSPCGCVLCYCTCAHIAESHNRVGCTVKGCHCDIGTKPTAEQILNVKKLDLDRDIELYLKSLDV